jgi:precorrin-6A/cobalt-precorrin-6A reductase
MRLLLIGGTSEASLLARRLAGRSDMEAILSLAGRTARPAPSALPTRIGGFGGVEGLTDYLRAERIGAVVDATHPFAAQISRNALAACAQAKIPLIRFTRPPWVAEPGDRWIEVGDASQAAEALGPEPKRVFLTVGRLQLPAFRGLPHHFLLRTIDPPESLPGSAEVILAKGPFTVMQEIDLMRAHAIDVLVSKNSGGSATEAKIEAARRLKLPVVMIQRPPSLGPALYDIEQVLAWIEAHRSASP